MASSGVWGIDIGQCGLKALRCELSEDGASAVATAYDFIEYPMILSQPDADAEDLVREAFETFLSRNKTKGDRIAMSVSGQFGLTRFFGPPPCQAKQLPELVRFEAKQTVPFPLDEVVWDWHRMAGGMEVEGFMMEIQVGLFAMKREQVFKALAPFTRAGLEIDIIQLAPVAIYNAITHDLLNDANGEFDSENPDESQIVLSMGTDTTDLVITNGYRMWLRSIPVGGSHFTKSLVKELKLTFSKAEHTKRNARQAEDPKAIFQSMRNVFTDMVNEVQRSLMNFENNNRKAKLAKLVLLGNAAKLPGLNLHLAKNLGYDLLEYNSFQRLDTTAISTSPSYKDNLLSFGVCYGLCLQGLNLAKVPTNLMPREIVTQRIIREKKPWTLAGVSALLLAWAMSYFLYNDKWYTVNPERAVGGTTWDQASKMAENVANVSRNHKSTDDSHVSQLNVLKALGDEVAGNNDRRLMWLELMSVISTALPRTPNTQPGVPPNPRDLPFTQRQEIHVEYIESEYFPDLSQWWSAQVKEKYLEGKREVGERQLRRQPPAPPAPAADPTGQAATGQAATGQAATGQAATDPNADPAAAGEDPGPTKEGWVIELKGTHYYNGDPQSSGRSHLYNTLLSFLELGTVQFAGDMTSDPIPRQRVYSMRELGILYPTLIQDDKIDQAYRIANPLYDNLSALDGEGGAPGGAPGFGLGGAPGGAPGGGLGGGFGAGGGAPKAGVDRGKNNEKKDDKSQEPDSFEAPRYSFTMQFVWQPIPQTKRQLAKLEQEEKDRTNAAAGNAAAPGAAADPVAPAPGTAVPGAPVAPAVPGAPVVPGAPAVPGAPVDPVAPAPGAALVPGAPVPGAPVPGAPGAPVPAPAAAAGPPGGN